ncbi:MAG: hypothetical protein RL758_1095 [Pseudomonadota bacterium]|jgi:hypothetical protein
MSSPMLRTALVGLTLLSVTAAQAQTIEKMKLTDGELTCTQLYAEGSQMDTVIRATQSMAPAPAPAAPPAAPQMVPGGNNTQAIMQANNLSRQDLVMTQQMMLQSRDIRVRAAASDPQAVAQYAVLLRNPQLAAAAQRAAVAGVNPAIIQGQINAAALAQGYSGGIGAAAAANQATGAAIVNQGQRYQQLVAAGVPWQQALAQAQAESQGGAVQQAVSPPAQAAMPAQSGLAQQALARKEHLTGLFLKKGCKLSEIQR